MKEDLMYEKMMEVLYERWIQLQGTPAVLAWGCYPDVVGVFDLYELYQGKIENLTEFAAAIEQRFGVTEDAVARKVLCFLHSKSSCVMCTHDLIAEYY